MNLFISIFDQKFRELHNNSVKIIQKTPADKLFWQPRRNNALFPVNSCGEFILRSAGKVEQMIGGLTTKLWDDPFEWTLPEQLSTNELILEYLDEVENSRQNGFAFFSTDEELKKSLPAPIKITTLFEVLVDTLAVAANYQGQAIGVFRQFSNEKIG